MLYSLAAVEINTAGAPIVISQITEQSIDPAIQKILSAGGGQIDNTYVAIGQHAPTISFSTTDLNGVLDLAGINALAIDQGASPPNGMTLWFRARKLGAGFEPDDQATDVHIKLFVNFGMLVPISANAAINGDASISMQIIPIWDGTNDPIVITDEIPFTTDFPAVDADHYTIGKWWINDILLDFNQSMTVNFGINVDRKFAAGSVFPSWAGILSRTPTITCQTLDIAHIGDKSTVIGGGVLGQIIDPLKVTRAYFQKRVPGGGVVADAVAEHVSFQLENGQIEYGNITGSQGDHAGMAVTLTPIKPDPDAANDVMIIDTAATQDAV